MTDRQDGKRVLNRSITAHCPPLFPLYSFPLPASERGFQDESVLPFPVSLRVFPFFFAFFFRFLNENLSHVMKHLDGSKSIRFRTSRSESDLQSVSPIDPSSGGNSGPDRRLTQGELIQRNAENLQLANRYSGATIATTCTVFLLLLLTVIGLSARMNVDFGANISRQNTGGEEGKVASEAGQREGGDVSFVSLLPRRIFHPAFSAHVPVMLQKYKALRPYVVRHKSLQSVISPAELQGPHQPHISPSPLKNLPINSQTT